MKYNMKKTALRLSFQKNWKYVCKIISGYYLEEIDNVTYGTIDSRKEESQYYPVFTR